MEQYLQISKINDYMYCPVSIYLHSLYNGYSTKLYHQTPQVVGKINHISIDTKTYSTSTNFIMALDVCSDKYKLVGKIDVYDKKNKVLIERKTKIKKIYDGYRYQLYAQYFCMTEMGYDIKKMYIYSLEDNKRYPIPIPDKKTKKEFESILKKINSFDLLTITSHSCEKCRNSIYGSLSW